MPRKITYEEFVSKVHKKFKDIDISNVDKTNFDYTNNKYLFKCKKHNETIYITPKLLFKHKDNNICTKCYSESISLRNKNKSHINYKKRKYKYTLEELNKNKIDKNILLIKSNDLLYYTKNDIIRCYCKKHNLTINSNISQLLNNKFICKKCRQEQINNKLILNGAENRKSIFIESSLKQHGNYYDYSKVDLNGKLNKVEIICPKHGSFWMMPSLHISRGQGCPKCNMTCLNNERRLGVILNEFINDINNKYNYNINIISQYHYELKRQSLDYCIYNNKFKIGIEYQGPQHFSEKEYKYFFDYRHTFEHRCNLDIMKYNKCKDLNIKIFYFTFNKKYNNIKYIDKVYTDIDILKYDILTHIKEKMET